MPIRDDKGTKQLEKQKLLPGYFSLDEIHHILDCCLKHNNVDTHFLINFLWRTGVRVSEAIAILASDVDFADNTIRVRSLRRGGNHIRFIPFTTDFAGHIKFFIECHNYNPVDRLFPFSRKTAYNKIALACKKAGFNAGRANPQTMRHSFAVNLLSQGMPLNFIQDCLGHRDIAETIIYTWIVNPNPRILFNTIKF